MTQDLAAWWAEVYFGRSAFENYPDTETFSDEVAWLAEADDASEEMIILERIAQIHERYSEWGTRYNAAQLSQGLWAMFSYPSFYGERLLNRESSFELRARAMRSLVVPYRVYVKGRNPDEAMPHGWDMLWDLILGHEDPGDMGDIALECLSEILVMDDPRCQAYALHGLNHLEHPDRPTVVQEWMDAHRTEDWNWAWVEACRDGTAM